MKKGMKRRTVIAASLFVIAAAALVLPGLFGLGGGTSGVYTPVTPLAARDLQATINVSGVVASRTSTNVYSTQTLLIKEIRAEVGDRVKAGDVLLTLDTANLEKDIEAQIASNDYSNTTTSVEVDLRRRNYQTALSNYQNGLNPELVQARSAVTNAEADLDMKRTALGDAELLLELGEASESDVTNARRAVELSQTALQNAQKTLSVTENAVAQNIQSLYDAYRSALAAASNQTQDINIAKLEQTLEDAIVTATADGTITASYGKVGAAATGLLFVIEDTGSLEIRATAGEYDISELRVGQSAVIRAGGLGNEPIAGKITRIAPTAKKAPDGSIIETNDVQFELRLSVDERNTGLLIGMNTRAEVLIDEKRDVYAVAYDALFTDAEGSYILAAEPGEQDRYYARRVAVEPGFETDFYIAISGDALYPGLRVITSPGSLKDGDQILLDPADRDGAESAHG